MATQPCTALTVNWCVVRTWPYELVNNRTTLDFTQDKLSTYDVLVAMIYLNVFAKIIVEDCRLAFRMFFIITTQTRS